MLSRNSGAAKADVERFLSLSAALSPLAQSEGIQVRTHHDASLPLFSVMPAEQRQDILQRLEIIVRLASELKQQGKKVASTGALTWAFLQQANLTAPPALFEKLNASPSIDEDCLDVYNRDHQLIFGNIRLFALTSYTLEEMYCLPWDELYFRDRPDLLARTFQLCAEMAEGLHQNLIPTFGVLPPHIILESRSQEKRAARIIPKFFCPLFKGQQPAGYVCSNLIELL